MNNSHNKILNDLIKSKKERTKLLVLANEIILLSSKLYNININITINSESINNKNSQYILHQISSFLELNLIEKLKNIVILLSYILNNYNIKSEYYTIEILDLIKKDNIINKNINNKWSNKILSSYKTSSNNSITHNIVIYGLGRIGKMILKILLKEIDCNSELNDKINISAIILREETRKNIKVRIDNILNDSVHQKEYFTIKLINESLLKINSSIIKLIYIKNFDNINFKSLQLNNIILIESTGKIIKDIDKNSYEKLQKDDNIRKIILTYPYFKYDVPSIVFGINNELINNNKIISATSCTTNAVIPFLKIMNDEFDIQSGHIEAIHAYTNSQSLIDSDKSTFMKSKAAGINIIPSSTGLSNTISKVIPSLDKKVTAHALRVPVICGSIATVSLNFNKKINIEKIKIKVNELNKYDNIIKISNQFNTSSTITGSEDIGIIELNSSIINDRSGVFYIWYDNEAGYSKQLLNITKFIINKC